MTPLQLQKLTFLAEKRKDREAARYLNLQALAFRGKPDAIKKVLDKLAE